MSEIEILERKYLLLINSEEIIDSIDWSKVSEGEFFDITQSSDISSSTAKIIAEHYEKTRE